ncbi:MAG: metal ABC transporter substrate-binding protein [Oscillospiraceae bacterium]|nr:metal ABC transporter substrate-binding protein [Oscillospiraceae bacterium]
MKRTIALVAVTALLAATLLLVGCNQTQTSDPMPEHGQADANEPLRVIATIFPQFDFVRQIAGDRVALSMLISPGAESHGFEPTARDIIALNEADLFIYVGGHGDTWVASILASLDRDDLRSVALVELVDTVVSDHHDHDHHHNGHHHDHSHDHHHGHSHNHDNGHHHSHADDHAYDEDHDHHGHHHHEPHLDEHVWTSPQNAIMIVRALTDILAEMDPDNAEFFRENAEAYIAELQALDQAFAEVVAQGVRNTVIFGDRFPFRYLMDAYGLRYYAAFPGCSAETQASPATIAYLIQKVRNENIPIVFYIEFSNRMIANVIAEDTDAQLLELHSTHNVSHSDFNAGVTYLELMRRNVEQLREALS